MADARKKAMKLLLLCQQNLSHHLKGPLAARLLRTRYCFVDDRGVFLVDRILEQDSALSDACIAFMEGDGDHAEPRVDEDHDYSANAGLVVLHNPQLADVPDDGQDAAGPQDVLAFECRMLKRGYVPVRCASDGAFQRLCRTLDKTEALWNAVLASGADNNNNAAAFEWKDERTGVPRLTVRWHRDGDGTLDGLCVLVASRVPPTPPRLMQPFDWPLGPRDDGAEDARDGRES